MDRKWKKRILCITLFFGLAITGCGSDGTEEKENSQVLSEESSSGDALVNGEAENSKEGDTTEADAEDTDKWKWAASTPYGKYPQLVTYTLGQMSGANNSNLPEGNTYEDNAYTRYLKQILNIQNRNIYMESED